MIYTFYVSGKLWEAQALTNLRNRVGPLKRVQGSGVGGGSVVADGEGRRGRDPRGRAKLSGASLAVELVY